MIAWQPKMINLTPLEIVLFLLISITIYGLTKYGKRLQRWLDEWRKQRRGPRQLRPREPEACPLCRAGLCWMHRHPREVVPWPEVKGRAGRKKRVESGGYACLNVLCEYYGIADADVHALVSDGCRGQSKDIQYWRCQACGGRRTSRLETPMYHIRTRQERVAIVMTALSEGVDLSAATRIFGHHHTTVSRWLERGGAYSARLHERLLFRMVVVGHLQLDELVTRVKRDTERVFVWTAVAARSKLILATHIGSRTTEDACSLLHEVRERLVPECLPVFTSDGLNQYFYGITAHFGYWHKPARARKYHWAADEQLQYAQLRKDRSGRRVRFLYSIIRLGTRPVMRLKLLALELSGKVQTAYVERANLTLRELIAPLSRRTWSMAHDRYHLWLHIQWGLAYYHLVRPHQSLQVKVRGPSRHRYRTPAMAAGLTRRRWTVAEILLTPVPERIWLQPFPVA